MVDQAKGYDVRNDHVAVLTFTKERGRDIEQAISANIQAADEHGYRLADLQTRKHGKRLVVFLRYRKRDD